MSSQPSAAVASTSVPTPAAGPASAAVRAVFLDVDGTYADYGVVPDGHVRAVQAARAAGHKVFLCTGRPLSMLPPSILAAGFDGVVASAGAYVQVAGEVLVDRRLPDDLAYRAVAALDAHGAVYILEAVEALYAPESVEARLRSIVRQHFSNHPDGPEAGSSAILGAVRPLPAPADAADLPAFAKVSVFESPVPMEQLVTEIGDGIAVVANSIVEEGRHAGELYQAGLSKADGVAAAIAHLGIAREDTVAVGDGENDLEMIAYAGIGVVIEGSSPALMALADRTAAPPHEEGLVAAFAELGLAR
ncbi:HAD-IIB family hydrolase [Pseudarthrobacter sp. J75]|uniref:HAD-IIB family hydrolase n=1 Tax=unclassified Pseudarthrobacter TaxID=2647000 RepID=UPI002E814980|nr:MULTISPECIES: HAD-IIB family hydrolase [unclassified Pseudarthrobacter]MEE2522044.1 HAD-IIB family hydrolase [Pseudarthrobacter sp. J47]MEE2528969.1 HAD-IIB family hydrolase [Pseudarthrobacter sp. J75]